MHLLHASMCPSSLSCNGLPMTTVVLPEWREKEFMVKYFNELAATRGKINLQNRDFVKDCVAQDGTLMFTAPHVAYRVVQSPPGAAGDNATVPLALRKPAASKCACLFYF
jgi:hypothetical protein